MAGAVTTSTGASAISTHNHVKKQKGHVSAVDVAKTSAGPAMTSDGGTAGSGHPGGMGASGKHPKHGGQLKHGGQ